MLDSLGDIVSFFSIPYSIIFLYSLFVLILQKKLTKMDCIFLAFFLFVIFLSCFYHFLSKRYNILLFFPSILIIGKAFSQTLHRRIFLWGFFPLIVFCLIYYGIKYYNAATLPSYDLYFGQTQQLTHSNSYRFFLSEEENLDERNRLSFYLQKDIIYYPDFLNYNKPDYESTQISGNKPFYYIIKRKSSSKDSLFRDLKAGSLDFRTVLSFYTDRHRKKKIEIIRADQLSSSFSTSTKTPVLSQKSIITENFSDIVSESKSKYFTFDHNRVVDYSPEESRFTEILVDKRNESVLRIKSKRFLYYYLINGLSVASSYNVSIKLYSYDAGLLMYSIYYYDNQSRYLSNTNYFLYALQKNTQPITISFTVMKDAYHPESSLCRPYFSFLGDIAVESIVITPIEN